MDYELIEVDEIDAIRTHIVIDLGNGERLSMLKSKWDELEAAKENGTIS
jgi:hypothetical protein